MREIIAKPEVRMELGHAGENGVARVVFDILKEWKAEVGAGGTLQLLVQMDHQDAYPAAVELQGDKAVWLVTAAETVRSGDGQAQLSYLLDGKVAKSACYSYTILPSLEETAGAVPPEQVNPWYTHIEQVANEAHTAAIDAKDSAKKSAAAAKTDADRAKAEADRTADKAPKTYTDATFANAIRETLVGTSVSTDMVSPVQHEVGCKVYSENLIPFPFREQPTNWRGVAFTYENGVITANGTATENVYIQLLPRDFKMGAGSYTISGCPKIRGCLIQARYDGKLGKYDTGDGVSFEVQQELTGLLIQINAGTTVENAVFKPKLQFGTTHTPFTPYISDLSIATVNIIGENILPRNFPLFPVGSKTTVKGLTFTALENGGILLDGTLTESNAFVSLANIDLGTEDLSTTRGSFENTNGVYAISKYLFYQASKKLIYADITYVGEAPTLHEVIYPLVNKGTRIIYDSFTPAKDGTVRGMNSLNPDMTIFPDTEGINIKATYNCDTRKYIDKKFSELNSAILSLGGNI